LPDFIEEVEVYYLDTDNGDQGDKDAQDASEAGYVSWRISVFEQKRAWKSGLYLVSMIRK
jgi:hypothetical protein